MLQSFFANQVVDILDVPKDAGWYMHKGVTVGYPLGKWEVVLAYRRTSLQHAIAGRMSWVSLCRSQYGGNELGRARNYSPPVEEDAPSRLISCF
jgi:hypothetical protein